MVKRKRKRKSGTVRRRNPKRKAPKKKAKKRRNPKRKAPKKKAKKRRNPKRKKARKRPRRKNPTAYNKLKKLAHEVSPSAILNGLRHHVSEQTMGAKARATKSGRAEDKQEAAVMERIYWVVIRAEDDVHKLERKFAD